MRPSLRKAVAITMLILSCSIFHQKIQAQHIILGNEKVKIEAGLNFGPTFFLGDLGGNRGKGTTFVKDVNLELTRLMKGAFISIYPTPWIGLRFAAQYTYVAGQDNLINTKGTDELYRKARNLDFKSHMWEAYTALELLPTMIFNKDEDYEPRIKPYGFIGIGLFHFDPQGSITNANGTRSWYKLHPLHTEGQGFPEYPDVKEYKLTQVNLPMGAGIKYDLTSKITIASELLYRKTFTDYIDDVSTTYIDPVYFNKYLSASDAAIARKIHDKTISSLSPGVNQRVSPGDQRGNVHNNDAYFSFVVKFGIKLGPDNSEEGRQMRQTKCPHFY